MSSKKNIKQKWNIRLNMLSNEIFIEYVQVGIFRSIDSPHTATLGDSRRIHSRKTETLVACPAAARRFAEPLSDLRAALLAVVLERPAAPPPSAALLAALAPRPPRVTARAPCRRRLCQSVAIGRNQCQSVAVNGSH